MISDSDSDSEQAPPNDPREGTGRDVADVAEAASALQRARDADARRLAADAAADAAAEAMVAVEAVEAAAGSVAASFMAARDNQRLNSPEAYSALASAYYDQRASLSRLSAADAARSRLSAASSQGHGGGGRVSAAAANAVPSPVEIARGENAVASAPPARGAGSLIAFDPNYRPRLWQSAEAARTAIDAALSVADIVLPTFPDEQALYRDTALATTAERIANAGPKEVVVKDGAEPALVVMGTDSSTVAATHVANPVDTTGAGDSFNGGYLAARLLGHNPVEAARRAHRVAAAVVQVRGALAPVEVLREAFAG